MRVSVKEAFKVLPDFMAETRSSTSSGARTAPSTSRRDRSGPASGTVPKGRAPRISRYWSISATRRLTASTSDGWKEGRSVRAEAAPAGVAVSAASRLRTPSNSRDDRTFSTTLLTRGSIFLLTGPYILGRVKLHGLEQPGKFASHLGVIVRFPELPAFQKLTTYWSTTLELPHTLAGGVSSQFCVRQPR